MRKLLPLLVCVGCGGGSDADPSAFIGVYQTTSHTSVDMLDVACTSAGSPVPRGDPYFKLAVDTLFEDPSILRLSGCSDAAGAACVDTITSMSAGGPGLENISANSQVGGGTACQLYWSRAQATLTGTAIHIELLEKYAATNDSPTSCTYEKAAALADVPTCRRVEHWDGTRL